MSIQIKLWIVFIRLTYDVILVLMCGRFTLRVPWHEVHAALDLIAGEAGRNTAARHNIAPSQDILTVALNDEGDRIVRECQWGLIPSWAKADKPPRAMINARGETVHEKPFFRGAFRYGRCLVPADGWYEWTKEPDGKQPHLIEPDEGGVIAFAGIWSENEALATRTAAIVTLDAAPSVSAIHNRMPAVLKPDAWAAWLDRDTPLTDAHDQLGHVRSDFKHHPVDRAINLAKAKGPAEPINWH